MGQKEVEDIIRKKGRLEINELLKELGLGRTAILNSIRRLVKQEILEVDKIKENSHWRYYYSIKNGK